VLERGAEHVLDDDQPALRRDDNPIDGEGAMRDAFARPCIKASAGDLTNSTANWEPASASTPDRRRPAT
jgi:hypothetical protein